MENTVRNNAGEGEVDLAEIAGKLWVRRRFIGRVAAAVVALGLIVAIFGDARYTASTVFVPQTGGKSTGGSLQGLAAMAGIDVKAETGGDMLSPLVYPMVAGSVPFRKELMRSEVSVGDETATLLEALTDSRYRKFSLFGTLGEYTLGLPGLILKALRGAPDEIPATRAGIETLSEDERECMKMLEKMLSADVNDKSGYVTISASMPEAMMSAEVAARACELLQQYVTRFKLQKVRSNLDFIEARHAEAKADFEARQQALARYQDANRDISSAVARTRLSRLENEYNLAYAIYSELARNREQAQIKVKEDTPTFTVIEPVTVPTEKSAPRRAMIMAASLALGLFAGVCLALFLPWAAGLSDAGWLRKWKEE